MERSFSDFASGRLKWRRTERGGQTVVEYLLLLASAAAFALLMGILFHKKILGAFFTVVGMIIGAGKPT